MSFDVLQIGTRVYSNVTVTTRTADYVFVLHSGGLNNFKVAELSPEVREQLGYDVPKKGKSASETAQTWAKATMAKVDTQQLKVVEQQLQQRFGSRIPADFDLKKVMTPQLLMTVGAVLLVCHLFFSWCCALICVKAGSPPGLLVWVPLLQLIPMLRAAGMPGLWFLAYFVPLLNIVAQVVWSFKIAQARNKSALVGILLLLPVLNVFAFLFLAFSNGAKAEKPERKIQIMTLETA